MRLNVQAWKKKFLLQYFFWTYFTRKKRFLHNKVNQNRK